MPPMLCEPRKTQRQAQADARREQLLAVALDIFAEKGIRATTIKDLAQAAGVADGLIAHYFGSKSGLVLAVLERFNLCNEMDSLLEQARQLPARDALRLMGQGYLQVLERNRKYVTVIVSEAIRDQEVANVLARFMGEGLRRAQDFLNERVALGELREHDVTVTLRTLQGSTLWFFLMNERLAPELPMIEPSTFVDKAVEIITAGIDPVSRGSEAESVTG